MAGTSNDRKASIAAAKESAGPDIKRFGVEKKARDING